MLPPAGLLVVELLLLSLLAGLPILEPLPRLLPLLLPMLKHLSLLLLESEPPFVPIPKHEP